MGRKATFREDQQFSGSNVRFGSFPVSHHRISSTAAIGGKVVVQTIRIMPSCQAANGQKRTLGPNSGVRFTRARRVMEKALYSSYTRAHRPKGEGIYFLSLTTSDWTSAGLSKMRSKMFVLMA
jgi:hypothetical protein